jgi:3-oxoacyl-[acyl-carrier-protein] synthase-3
MARYATILGTGMVLPENEYTNEMMAKDLAAVNPKLADVVGKFEASSNIKTRFRAPEGCVTSDLAARAAEEAMRRAGVKPEDIDIILLGTDSPDYITPATSVVVQHKIGAKNAGTYDIGCACASFPTGMASAAGLLATNPWMKYALVIGSYMMSKLADPTDVSSFFYGDGAGAAVLGVADKPGFIASAYLADGAFHKSWGIYSGGTYEPATVESVQAGRTKVRLIERYPPEVNNEGWPRLTRDLVKKGGFNLQEIDMIIFTQVRLPSIQLVMEDLGLPIEKAHWIMDKWGYTGSACIPMALHDAIEQGKIHSGDLVVLVGSGVGFNQAATAFCMP